MSEQKKEQEKQKKPLTGSIFALIALIGLLLIFQFSLNNNTDGLIKGAKKEKVLGVSEKEKVDEAKKTIQQGFEDKLQELQKQVMNLDPKDVVTSSPQVKKIINDLKSLEGLPKSQLKQVCESLCSGI
jgi:hypothetical protein